jgi:hypothetical protein
MTATVRHRDAFQCREEQVTVFDVGCAVGTTARLMAEMIGASWPVVGPSARPGHASHRLSIYSSEMVGPLPQHTRRVIGVRVDYAQDCVEALPLCDAAVDVAWWRFLLELSP